MDTMDWNGAEVLETGGWEVEGPLAALEEDSIGGGLVRTTEAVGSPSPGSYYSVIIIVSNL